MDHAYTMSGSQNEQTRIVTIDKTDKVTESNDVEEEILDDQEDDQTDDFDSGQDNYQGEDQGDDTNDGGGEDCADDAMDRQENSNWNATTYTVLLPTEEWMQMLPPQYLLHYIRERTVCRESGRVMRDSTTPLKRGWLQGSWRETIKDAIAKQTPIPCVINFNSSNFLKQPFSRKVGPPLWRVKACCRQNDGQCLKFNLKVQDFHPSKPHVEIEVSTEGTLLEGPEGESRHTFTASDHMRALKSLQRYQTSTPQTSVNGCLDGTIDQSSEDTLQEGDDFERLTLQIPTEEWISFLPAEAADAYVLERSSVSKDRLAIESQEAWSRGSRLFVPRVTKECRQYLKRALADRTGLPCRIGLTGRCHLKPPFSRKKRAPLFVTNGFCGRKEHKCLRFKFTVQDFDPRAPNVDVEVEVRGQLLDGPEGEDWHSRRPTDDLESSVLRSPEPAPGAKRPASGAAGAEALNKKARLAKRGRTSLKKDAPADAYAEAVQALQAESWPGDFDLQTAEVVLEEDSQAKQKAQQAEFVAEDGLVNAIQVLSEDGQETALGEDAARELMQLANEALSLAGGADGDQKTRFTATKIVQSGDQVFIFVGDPAEGQEGGPPTIEAVEVSGEELAAVVEPSPAVATPEAEQVLRQYEMAEQQQQRQQQRQQQQQLDQDLPCMEYHWEMKLPMAEWLRLLPAKSLRYYVHERTVGREVWVEEGWEKQFRCQTLQQGWRDVVRRAVVEQTDIPCQMCFRGRSSLKLPFSRKHSAALWRTQGYCSKGDRSCLVYKFCVQDFHPDDEFVTVQVNAVGKLHRDCRRWFSGVGTVVAERSEWPEYEAEVEADAEAGVEDAQELLKRIKNEPEPAGDEWEPDQAASDPEHEEQEPEHQELEHQELEHQEPEQEHEEEQAQARAEQEQQATVTSTVGDEFYVAALKSIDVLKNHLSKARRCPLKMQAALRLLRSAQVSCAAPCKTPACLCRPSKPSFGAAQPSRSPAKSRWRWPRTPPRTPSARARESVEEQDGDAGHFAEPDAEDDDDPEPVPAATPRATQVTPSRAEARARPAAATPDSKAGWRTKVTRSGPLVLTAMTPASAVPTIIRLSPAQIAAGARAPPVPAKVPVQPAPASSKLGKLSSAIERSALPTPAVVRPLVSAASPTATSTPAVTTVKGGRRIVVRSRPAREEPAQGDAPAEDGSDPSWIMEEMRSVILDGEEAEAQERPQAQAKAQTPSQAKAAAKPVAAAPQTPKTKLVEEAEEEEEDQQQQQHQEGDAEEGVEQPKETRMKRARVMVEKIDSSALPVVSSVRSLSKPNAAVSTASRVIPAPSRPVTRGTKVLLATAANNPPPLVPISRGPTAKSQSAPHQTASRVSQVAAAEAKAKAEAPSPSKPAKLPTRTVQTRLLTAVSSDNGSLPQGGKVLILKPSMPMLRSSPRKSS